jgi:hypothetical protein
MMIQKAVAPPKGSSIMNMNAGSIIVLMGRG